MKKILHIVFLLALLFIIISIGSGFYMLNYALTPAHGGKFVDETFADITQHNPVLKHWLDSLNQASALKDTFIHNKDGVRLHAWYIRAAQPTAKTAVLVHGYTDNAVCMMKIGYLYNHDLNYNILLPDLQFHGESGGKAIQMGWKDRLDVLQWMEVAHQLYGDSTRMVVHGISMGAATTMMLSGETQKPYVKCFVEDCGYTSVWEQFSKEIHEQFNLPDFPVLYAASWLCDLTYGWNFKEASSLEQVKKCTLPMFFIHGDADAYVPTWMVHPLYEAKPDPKALWIVPGAAHAVSYDDYPEEYTVRVKAFVDLYI